VTVLRIETLARHHDTSAFDCGSEHLNTFITRYARQNQKADGTQTYVCLAGDSVAGFATLAVGHIEHAFAPDLMKKGLARHPVPVMSLAWLAVDKNWQGRGIGASLLKDMMVRTIEAAEIAGVRALIVQAKDEAAMSFYKHYGFQDGFPEPLHHYILTRTLRDVFGK
jgi:ribosomal protein S18 acetylase RimI-like enzyme